MDTVLPGSAISSRDKADHLCRHSGCDRWGAWGYDGGEGVTGWWCLEHRPGHDPIKPVVEQSWVSDGNEG